MVAAQQRTRARLGHHLSIHLNAPFGNQLLGPAPRSHSGTREQLLQPLTHLLVPFVAFAASLRPNFILALACNILVRNCLCNFGLARVRSF